MQMGWLPFFKQLQLQCSFAYTSPLFGISAEKANLSIREIAKSAIHLSQSQHTGIRKPNTYRPTLRMCDMCCRVQASAANGHQMTQQHCQSNRNKWSQQSGLVLLLRCWLIFFPFLDLKHSLHGVELDCNSHQWPQRIQDIQDTIATARTPPPPTHY